MPTSHDANLAIFTADLIVVARAYRSVADRALADLDLSQATAWPIVMIGRLGEGVRQGAVAEALGIEGPTLVRVLDQLVASELIQRHEDPSDRRAKTLHLTPAGRALREKVETVLIDVRRQVFADIDPADIEATLRVLGTLKGTLKCFPPKAFAA
ncbi:MAG: MarR family transcriptional regulator [Burkholderiaceae bacterium]